MKTLFAIILLVHGLLHLTGFVRAFDFLPIKSLTLPIGKFWGVIWLLAFVLFALAAWMFISQQNAWWKLAIIAVFVSQILILLFWKDAKYGSLANIIILVISIVGYAQYNFIKMVKSEIIAIAASQPNNPTGLLNQTQLQALPEPVQRWLNASGMAGQKTIQHVTAVQQFKLKLKPDQEEWYHGTAYQEVWTEQPAFIWTLDMRMMPMVSVAGRDIFADGKGKMLIKILSLMPVVNERENPRIDQGALQRYLAEMLWYPSFALSEFVSWKSQDENSATATMNYRGTSGDCTFFFNSDGMPERISAMRFQGGDEDAKLTEWIIDVQELQLIDGLIIPNKCAITWKLESGDWTWAEMEVTEIRFGN